MEATPGADKATLRQQLRRARQQLKGDWKAAADAALARQVLAWHAAYLAHPDRAYAQDARALGPPVLGVYWPLRGEPDLNPAYAELADRGVQLRLPLVEKKHHALAFVEWTPGEAMDVDAMGIAVPRQRRPAPLPSALLVPCLGFTPEGYRLGYGGGFYDRTLAVTPRPYTVGIAYAADQVRFPGDSHDVALDLILTEDGAAPGARLSP